MNDVIRSEGVFTFDLPTPEHLVMFYGADNKPVATVRLNGAVEIHQDGGEKKAAMVFWDAIGIHGATLNQQIAALAARVAELERDAVTPAERALLAYVLNPKGPTRYDERYITDCFMQEEGGGGAWQSSELETLLKEAIDSRLPAADRPEHQS
jgi:hypothetical protein